MPEVKFYRQLSNDAHNKSYEFMFSDFTSKDIPTRVGDDVSSLQAWEMMTLNLAVKRTHSASANIAFTNCLRGRDSLQSSAGRDICVVAAHSGFDIISSSQPQGQLLLDGRQRNDHGIGPVGLGAIMFFGPSKVAKIKASDACVRPMSELRVQTAPAILMAKRRRCLIPAAANDKYGRSAA